MTATALLLLLLGVVLVVAGMAQARRSRRRRITQALDLELTESGPTSAATALAYEKAIRWAEGRTAGTPWRERMMTRLERARITLRPAEYVALRIAIVVGLGLVGLLFGLFAALVGLAVGAMLPSAVVSRRVTKRQRAFEAQLPDVLDLAASSMEAGHSLLTALQLVAEDAPEPLGSEVARVLSETEVGRPLIEALDAMALRLDVPDLNWTVEGVRIQSEVGGRLSEMLRTLSTFMRAREEVRRELRALTAEGKLSAYVLVGLPIAMLGVLSVIARDYVSTLFVTTPGRLMLGATIIMVAGSALMMRKIVDVEM
jgi:tight adherence protein B